MRLKRIAALTASLALVASATACSSSSSSASSGGKVTLNYGIWDQTQEPAMKQIVAAFEKQNPNITVDIQVTPYTDYFTKLQTAASGGSAPDVFWMNGPNFQLYASNGQLMSLSNAGIDTSDYPSSMVNLYKYNGTQYGVPKDFDTVGLWYNKAIFKAAGVALPTANWTWADFQAAAAKLTDKSKGIYGVGATLEGQENYYNTIFQAGGTVISADGKSSGYDSAASISGLEFWTNLISKGDSPTLAQMNDTAPYDMFMSGKLAMFWGGSWDAVAFAANANTKTNADVTVLPEGVKRATVIHGLANVVYAKSAHPDQAEKFAAFLGSKQAADIEASTGTVIPAYNGTQQAWVKAYPQYDLQSFLDELSYAVPYPISKDTAAWNALETSNLTKAWDLSESVPTAASQLTTQMNAALAKEAQ